MDFKEFTFICLLLYFFLSFLGLLLIENTLNFAFIYELELYIFVLLNLKQ